MRFPKHFEIVKTKVAHFIDPPKQHPELGKSQRCHSHYKCVMYTLAKPSDEVATPLSRKVEKVEFASINIDYTHLHVFNPAENAVHAVKDAKPLKPNVGHGKQIAKTYYIGDLIVPVQRPFGIGPPPNTVDMKEAIPKELQPKHMGQPIFGAVEQKKGITAKDADPLIELIENSIAMSTWAGEGKTGVGKIEFFPPNLSLIVTNTKEVHARLEDFIEKVRELRDVTIEVRSMIVVLPEEELALAGLPEEFIQQEMRTSSSIGIRDARKIQVMAMEKSWETLESIPQFSLLNGQSNSIGWKKFEALESGYLSLQSILHPGFRKNGQVRSTIEIHNVDGRRMEGQFSCSSDKVAVVDMSKYVLPEDTDQVALFLFRQLIIDDRPDKE